VSDKLEVSTSRIEELEEVVSTVETETSYVLVCNVEDSLPLELVRETLDWLSIAWNLGVIPTDGLALDCSARMVALLLRPFLAGVLPSAPEAILVAFLVSLGVETIPGLGPFVLVSITELGVETCNTK
jgi:hypothetical protein